LESSTEAVLFQTFASTLFHFFFLSSPLTSKQTRKLREDEHEMFSDSEKWNENDSFEKKPAAVKGFSLLYSVQQLTS
jgi:hypothetical protein